MPSPGGGAVWVLLLATLGGATFGAEPERPAVGEEGEADSLLEEAIEWVDEKHAALSGMVQSSALAIDRFFATDEYLEDTTDSYLRVITDLDYDTRDDVSGAINVRGKLDLPGTKRRFSLIVSGESDDPFGDDVSAEDDRESTSLAIERNPRTGLDGWRIRPSVGVKGGWPLDPYAQLRATRKDDLGGGWVARTQGTVRYLVDDQWDLRAEFQLTQVIDDEWSWRTRTSLRREDVDGYSKASQSFDVYQRVNDEVAMRHTLSVSGDDEFDQWEVDTYRYRFSWRRLIHSDWLFFEASPEIYFPREYDYEATGAVQLRLEAYIGGL